MNWAELLNKSKEVLSIQFDENWAVLFKISPLLLAFIAIGLVILLFLKKSNGKIWHRYDVVEGEIPIVGLGKVKIKPNNDTIKIAYQAWTELITRKVALPFEEENDVIIEVYNSWYSAFGILRELAKGIPAHKLRKDQNTRTLVTVMLNVLNNGLRPHLTKWQAKFLSWYNFEKEECAKERLSPQEIQRKYPEYDALIDDMKNVNDIMVKYAEWLQEIVEGKK